MSVAGDARQERLSLVVAQVLEELGEASEWFPPIRTPHEAIAVIREEYLELEQAVFSKHRQGRMHVEAVQLAAMAIRMLVDIPYL